MDDTYSRIVNLLRPDSSEAAATRLMLGKVQQLDPMIIETAGVSLPKEALRLNEQLKRDILSAADGVLHTEPPLQAGDRVLMITDDGQVFYVLAKVVSA